jgi:hypothetical protein
MLKAAYPAIKQADPTARVLMGGLSLNDYDFLQQMYDAGAAPYFDVAAVHPYTGSVDPAQCWTKTGTTRYAKEAFCGIAEVRKTMLANGDPSDLWLTEFGWSTAPVANGVTEATQAAYLTKAFNLLATYPYVTNAFWYSGRNNYWQADDQTDLEANYGLMKVNFALKPSYAAFQAYATAPVATTVTLPATTLPSVTLPPTTLPPTTLPPVTVPPVTLPPTTTTTADTQPPTITAVAASAVLGTSATIGWTTNEASTSVVRYWIRGSSTVSTASVPGRVVAHVVKLSALRQWTTYDFTVTSTDAAGNTRVSPVASFRTGF